MSTLFATETVLDYDSLMMIAESSFAALGLYGHKYNAAMVTACDWALTASNYTEAEEVIDTYASGVADSEEVEY